MGFPCNNYGIIACVPSTLCNHSTGSETLAVTVVITEILLLKLVFLTLTVTVRLTMITECLLLTTFRPSGVGLPQVSTTTITEKQSKIRNLFFHDSSYFALLFSYCCSTDLRKTNTTWLNLINSCVKSR